MNIQTITPPAVDAVSLADAKTRLSISDSASDDNIQVYIKAATQEAENYLERRLITQTVELSLSGFEDCILLPAGPVQSVTHVKYRDGDNAEQTLDSDVYELQSGNDRTPDHLRLAFNKSWPTTSGRHNAVIIRYDVGWGLAADLPIKIQQALMLLVGHWLRFQKEAESGLGPSRIPRQFYDLLNSYRIQSF